MEVKKFQEKLLDWAMSLGFKLPDESVPNADYFASLTITPHRRQLWETIIESVQPRQKVEHMRKQILVAKLLNRKDYLKSDSKHTEDRIELWEKQKTLETEIKQKYLEVNKLELSVMAIANDALFQFDLLAELEKQCNEVAEKILFLRLFKKRVEKIANDLTKKLKKGAFSSEINVEESGKESLEFIKNKLLNTEACKQSHDGSQYCDLLNEIDKFCQSGTELQLWEEMIKCKKNLLEKFSEYLEEFSSYKKTVLSEKVAKIEKQKTQSVMKLKQKITEKSLEVALNATEEKLLESEVEKLVEGVVCAGKENKVLDETPSSLSFNEINKSYEEKESLKNYLNLLGLKIYKEFLQEELKRVEDDEIKKNTKELKNEEALQAAIQTYEFTVDGIISSKAKGEETVNDIFKQYEKLQTYLRLLKEEVEDNTKTQAVEEIALKLCSAPEKLMEVFLDTPLDAFRTLENSSGRMMFECESPLHRLKNYRGELKLFCPAMLIPPLGDVERILAEIKRRNVISVTLKKFISERVRLVALQRKINDQLININYDQRLCGKNYVQCSKILENISFRTEKTAEEKELIEAILKFWLEQPFRFMIKEKDLSKYENQLK